MKRRGFLQKLCGGVVGGAVLATAKPESEPIHVAVMLDGKALTKAVIDAINSRSPGLHSASGQFGPDQTFPKWRWRQ